MEIKTPPERIYFLLLPGTHLMDLAGPAQVFGSELITPAAKLEFIGISETVSSAQGIQLAEIQSLPEQPVQDSWLIVVGSDRAEQNLRSAGWLKLEAWLSSRSDCFSRIVGICSGALVMAAAGLLDQRSSTTHHQLLGKLQDLAPLARVEQNCVFVDDGNICTSAGISAGIDLSLHLLSEHWGAVTAAKVARDLVIYQRRSGAEPQLGFWQDHRNHMLSQVHQAQDLVMLSPERHWTVESLANAVHLSSRHLTRLFISATGMGAKEYLQRASLAIAQRLLKTEGLSLEDVASQSGLGSERSLRRVWRQYRSDTPAAYRRHTGR